MARRTLSNEVKQGILDGLKNGTSPVLLAQQFGISVPTVYNYKNRAAAATATTTTNDAVVAATASVGLNTAVVTANRKASKVAR